MNEDIVIPGMFFITCIILGIGIPLIRARIRRMERASQFTRADPQLDDRLGRIEQAIDAMAVEVERISEGQRFVTRVLADRTPEPAALPRQASDRA